MSFCSLIVFAGSARAHQGFRGFVSASSVQMILKFATELFHDTDGWHGGSIPQWAEGAAEHVLGKFVNQVNVLAATEAGVEAVQHLPEPGGSLAAGDAPATRFVRVEVHDAACHVHHAGVLVHDHHAAGAQHAAGFSNGIVVHGQV